MWKKNFLPLRFYVKSIAIRANFSFFHTVFNSCLFTYYNCACHNLWFFCISHHRYIPWHMAPLSFWVHICTSWQSSEKENFMKSPQCGKLRNSLSLRFYVKSFLVISEAWKQAFWKLRILIFGKFCPCKSAKVYQNENSESRKLPK